MDSSSHADKQLRASSNQFDIGFSSWIENTRPGGEENEAGALPVKKSRLSLSMKKKRRGPPLTERFVSPSKTKSVYHKAAEGVIPRNTQSSTNWCVCTFITWLTQRNTRTANNPESVIPTNILESHDVDAVCRAMRLFVLEVRRVDGQCYPQGQFDRCLVD